MVWDEVGAINFPSVLEIPCDIINGQHLDTRTQLAENLQLIEVNFNIYINFCVKLFYFLLFSQLRSQTVQNVKEENTTLGDALFL